MAAFKLEQPNEQQDDDDQCEQTSADVHASTSFPAFSFPRACRLKHRRSCAVSRMLSWVLDLPSRGYFRMRAARLRSGAPTLVFESTVVGWLDEIPQAA